MMASPVVRRAAEPMIVQRLWTAITAIRSQKQVANEERIVRYIRREHGETAALDATSQLHLAVKDGLILEYRALVQKGSAIGTEQDAYRMSDGEIITSEHDWYCFECHHPGEVLECSTCWRVFHCKCIGTAVIVDFICDVCKETEKPSPIKPKELNRLLSFTILRLKEKSAALHWFGGAELGLDRFVHSYLDLNIMQERTTDCHYTNLEQFYADSLTIRHNIFVCFGEAGVLQEMAKVMLRDCAYDLDEIRQCKDCYLHSNIKNKDWFCQPCRASHELVFAKQKGFGYWPAKVIKATEASYDVRFFGARHQRALIEVYNIKPINTSPHVLGVKRTAGFVRACSEMARHQDLVQRAAQTKFEKSSGLHSDSDEKEEEREDDGNTEHNGSNKSTSEADIDSPPSVRRRRPNHKSRYGDHNGFRNSPAKNTYISSTKNGCNSRHNVEDSSVVSSSEDRTRHPKPVHCSEASEEQSRRLKPVECTDAGVQTIKLLSSVDEVLTAHRGTQTNTDSSTTCTADCEARFEVKLRDFRARVDRELEEKMQDALQSLEHRLRKEFEEDEQRAMQRALSTNARNTDVARQQMKKECQEQFEEERKRLLLKHAAEVSAAKKKQWCFNCESEAMYHCCWNTSYCSIKCQQDHWHQDHKRVCRRKRP